MSATRVAVVGCGLVGRAWAITFARAGFHVAMFDARPTAAVAALDFIRVVAEDLHSAGQSNGLDAATLCSNITPVDTLNEALDDAIHVQESTPERLDIKTAVFRDLDASAARSTTIASSSSGFVPSSFTEGLAGRERCLVAHPINPPYLIPAVEIVPAPWTSQDAVERVADLMRLAGQSPIVMKKELDGFVMNRLQSALLHEAFRLVAEGYANMEDVDIGIRDGLGLRWAFMGPFETIDLNAPGGIVDYVRTLGPMYARLWEGQRHSVDWTSPAEAMAIEAETRRPRDKLGERQLWRDRRLIALLNHKQESDARFGL